jgi:hypothetical protein
MLAVKKINWVSEGLAMTRALLDPLYRLSGHPREGADLSFQGKRLGCKFAMLEGVPVALGGTASCAMHPADRVAPNRRRAAL